MGNIKEAHKRADHQLESATTGKRKHRRIQHELGVRFLNNENDEFSGTILDLSLSGAKVQTQHSTILGDEIIAYIEYIGRIECKVVRIEEEHIALTFSPNKQTQKKISELLMAVLNDREAVLHQTRAKRFKDKNAIKRIMLQNGETAVCQVINISLTGASLKIADKPSIGQAITIGQMKAKVVRHHTDGIGVEFIKQQ